jgi:hypothetical protein
MRPSLKALNSRALQKLAVPAVLTAAVVVLATVPTQAQFVDAGGAPGSSDAGPIDGGGPVDLGLPLPMHETLPTDPTAPPGETSVVSAVQIAGGVGDIPANVLKAYKAAARSIDSSDQSCHLHWTVLAGIGKVESGHARGGALDETGHTTAPILGPVLAGGPGMASIHDTDGGEYDGNTNWDRAVGPMQFIPSSWRNHAADGNGDGKTDPSNIYDATLAAAGYLCTGDRDLNRTPDLRKAVFGYNHSWDYVATVLAWAQSYDGGAVAVTPVSLLPGADTATPAASSKHASPAAGKGTRAAAPGRATPPPLVPTPGVTPITSATIAAAAVLSRGEPTPTGVPSSGAGPSSGGAEPSATPTVDTTPADPPSTTPDPTPTVSDPPPTVSDPTPTVSEPPPPAVSDPPPPPVSEPVCPTAPTDPPPVPTDPGTDPCATIAATEPAPAATP